VGMDENRVESENPPQTQALEKNKSAEVILWKKEMNGFT